MNDRIFTAEVLEDMEQLWPAEDRFLAEIGEEKMSDERRTSVRQAAEEGRIVFFAVRKEGKVVGICSVSPCFSTFSCRICGVFDDFYVERAFRGKGAARVLTDYVKAWCSERGYGSLIVGSSPGDTGMYRSLGFSMELGAMLAMNL